MLKNTKDTMSKNTKAMNCFILFSRNFPIVHMADFSIVPMAEMIFPIV